VKAINLVTRREGRIRAVGGRAASDKNLFSCLEKPGALRNLGIQSLCDTPDPAGDSGENVANVTEAEVAAFIEEINRAFPPVALTLSDVTLVHRGLVPAFHAPAQSSPTPRADS